MCMHMYCDIWANSVALVRKEGDATRQNEDRNLRLWDTTAMGSGKLDLVPDFGPAVRKSAAGSVLCWVFGPLPSGGGATLRAFNVLGWGV